MAGAKAPAVFLAARPGGSEPRRGFFFWCTVALMCAGLCAASQSFRPPATAGHDRVRKCRPPTGPRR
jgi:hypothetical protein